MSTNISSMVVFYACAKLFLLWLPCPSIVATVFAPSSMLTSRAMLKSDATRTFAHIMPMFSHNYDEFPVVLKTHFLAEIPRTRLKKQRSPTELLSVSGAWTFKPILSARNL